MRFLRLIAATPFLLCIHPLSALPTSTMATSTPAQEPSYFNGSFTAPGLPVFRRTVTGHQADGLGHFLISDNGDHRVVRKAEGFNYEAAQAVLYGSFEVPTDINGVDDIDAIRQGYTVGGAPY